MWGTYFRKSTSSYFFLALALASLIVFWRFSLLVLDGVFPHVDQAVFIAVGAHRLPFLLPVVLAITDFGSVYTILFLMLLIFFFLIKRRSSYKIVLVVGTVFVASIANVFLKVTTGIVRPEGIFSLHDFSFPSGHATIATVFFLSALFVLWPELQNRTARFFFSATAIVFIFLVALSRVYLGVHWLSDVLGGMLFGLAVVSFGIYVYKKIGIMYQYSHKPHLIIEKLN